MADDDIQRLQRWIGEVDKARQAHEIEAAHLTERVKQNERKYNKLFEDCEKVRLRLEEYDRFRAKSLGVVLGLLLLVIAAKDHLLKLFHIVRP